MSQLQLVEREEIDVNELTAHGISARDVKKLQDAGINTCNGLLRHTKKDLTSIKGLSDAAKVDKICEAAEKLVVSDAMLKDKILCDEAYVNNVLGQPLQELVLRKMQEILGGEFQVFITSCTASSLVKANGILQDGFMIERCGHNPPIGVLDCVFQTALNVESSKIVVATGCKELCTKLIFEAPAILTLYATSRNNMRLLPRVTDNERMSEEETEPPMGKKKRDASSGAVRRDRKKGHTVARNPY